MNSLTHTKQMAKAQIALRQELVRDTDRANTVMRSCTSCAKRFRARAGKPNVKCPKCAKGDAVASVAEQKRREGPIYEKTVTAQLRYWSAEAQRLGIFVE